MGGASPDRIERVGFLLGFASAIYWIGSCFVDVPPSTDRIFQLTLLPHGCFFALDILIRARQRRRPGAGLLPWTCLIPICAAALIEIDVHRVAVNADEPAHIPPALLFAACLLPILFAGKLQSWLARHISSSIATTVGLMTCPLYLLHQELGAMLIGGMLHLGAAFWPAAAVAFVLVLILSWATVRFAEPPLRAMLKTFDAGRTPRTMRIADSGL